MKGHCGCIKKGYKCTSACSCNGSCTADEMNGKCVLYVMCKIVSIND
jgi:hypothetical protein